MSSPSPSNDPKGAVSDDTDVAFAVSLAVAAAHLFIALAVWLRVAFVAGIGNDLVLLLIVLVILTMKAGFAINLLLVPVLLWLHPGWRPVAALGETVFFTVRAVPLSLLAGFMAYLVVARGHRAFKHRTATDKEGDAGPLRTHRTTRILAILLGFSAIVVVLGPVWLNAVEAPRLAQQQGAEPLVLLSMRAAGVLGILVFVGVVIAARRRQLARAMGDLPLLSAVHRSKSKELDPQVNEFLGWPAVPARILVDDRSSESFARQGIDGPILVLSIGHVLLPLDELRFIVLHESAHVRNRDATIVGWVQPLVLAATITYGLLFFPCSLALLLFGAGPQAIISSLTEDACAGFVLIMVVIGYRRFLQRLELEADRDAADWLAGKGYPAPALATATHISKVVETPRDWLGSRYHPSAVTRNEHLRHRSLLSTGEPYLPVLLGGLVAVLGKWGHVPRVTMDAASFDAASEQMKAEVLKAAKAEMLFTFVGSQPLVILLLVVWVLGWDWLPAERRHRQKGMRNATWLFAVGYWVSPLLSYFKAGTAIGAGVGELAMLGSWLVTAAEAVWRCALFFLALSGLSGLSEVVSGREPHRSSLYWFGTAAFLSFPVLVGWRTTWNDDSYAVPGFALSLALFSSMAVVLGWARNRRPVR